MPITVKINNLSLCHRASGGVSKATLPDVCLTPPTPTPVAYRNIAFSKDLAKGTATVFADGGNSIAHNPSEFATSIGDEPGTAGGIKSGTFMKEATWLSFSMNVRFEGQGACRHSDKMFHNHANTINAAGLDNPPVGDGDADCNAKWDAVDAETKPIVDEPDHQKRNKMITEKYASLYKKNNDYEWAALAGVVSRQAGCNMVDAQQARGNWIAGGDGSLIKSGSAKDAYDALGEANRNIFKDIYPNHRFYDLYGWEALLRCSNAAGHRVPDSLKEAFKKMEEAKSKTGAEKARAIREASDKIAEYEQAVVVQNSVYSVERFKNVLDSNEYWSSGLTSPLGSFFGAKTPQISLSSECGANNPIMFDGSINNPNDRVNFYHKLMDEWIKQRNADPTGWSNMYDNIINWSRGTNAGSSGFIGGGGEFGGGGASGKW